MGSSSISDEEFNVLVTGFAPFKAMYPINPSWEIACSLPSYLPPPSAKDGSVASRPPPGMPPVRIHVHPEPIRVNYRVVRNLVPSLWEPPEPRPRIDLAIHIGMAGPKLVYSLEKLGHRDGYNKSKDVDDEECGDEEKRKQEGDDWIWAKCPEELETAFDTKDVMEKWKQHCPHPEMLSLSNDPGRFLCDFIYFSSLAHLYKRDDRRRVVFLHVPSDPCGEAVMRGRDITLQLIKSLVESDIEGRRRKTAGEL